MGYRFVELVTCIFILPVTVKPFCTDVLLLSAEKLSAQRQTHMPTRSLNWQECTEQHLGIDSDNCTATAETQELKQQFN